MFRSSLSPKTLAIGAPLAAIMLAAVGAAAPVPAPVPASVPVPKSTAVKPGARNTAQKVVARPTANPPVTFAQTQSDLAVDPGARFGRLANGMTYVIYKNGTPPGAASVWMRIAAGSVMEQDDQRGLAHFIEHMAFNGSKNVAEGEMIKLLERDGLQFGADTNAQTSDFETTYMLNLPDANPRVVGDALFLMRETAGNLLLDPGAIDRERGVILGEERARASSGLRAYEAELKQLFPGMTYPERLPIGKVDVIRNAKRPAFARFYNDFYRPEYATLIVVGDIDPDRIEAEIRRRFSDWRPPAPSPAARTDFGTLRPRTAPEAKVFVADGLPDAISVSWVAPAVDVVETKAKDLDDTLFAIAGTILGERYARAADTAGAPFIGAGLQRQDIRQTARLYALNIRPRDGQGRAAFEQAMTTLREFVANGPTQAELDRALLRFDRYFVEQLAATRTIPTQAITGKILKSLGERQVLQSPAQELAEFRELKSAVTLATLNAALKRIPLDIPPLLWRQGEQAAPFDEAAMLAAYRTVMAAPVQATAARTSVTWPYTRFGNPSAVTARQDLPAVGATRVTFANGVFLTVKRTGFEDNTVNVVVQLGNGIRGVRQDQGAVLFMAKQVGPFAGGLGKLASDDIREAIAGKIYGLGFSIDNDATSLNGATTTADLAVQMQLFAAFISDPGFRADAFDRIRAQLPSSYADARTSPDGVYALKADGDVYDDDPRFSIPSQNDALAVGNDSVIALLKDQFGHGPVEVTIVGDISVDDAVRQVGATLGALPPRPAAVIVPGEDRLRFPTRDLHRVYTHDGRSDQNLSAIAWPTTDYYADPRRAAALDLLAAIMTIRELEEVREKQGASYSASASSATSRYFPGFGFILSRATVRADQDDAYHATMVAIVDALKRDPVTADELTRARAPLIQRLHTDRNANGYWLQLLSGTVRNPRQLNAAATEERDLLSITPEDIRQQAQAYLDMSKSLRIQIKPSKMPATNAGSARAAPSDS